MARRTPDKQSPAARELEAGATADTSTPTPQRQRPRFTGVATYRDPAGRFSVRYPSDWYAFPLAGTASGDEPTPTSAEPQGVSFAPNPDDQFTCLQVWATQLDQAVVAEDAETLRLGIDDGLAQLTDAKAETAEEVVLGNLLKFERVFTFREGESLRKRRTWVIYADTIQIVLTWQGSTVEEYHYWLAMANYSFSTFQLPDLIWFSTDRELLTQLGLQPGLTMPKLGN